MSVNCGARPDVLPWFKIEAVDLVVSDPAASDPNAPVLMLYAGQPFKLTLKFKISGLWKPLFVGPGDVWTTNLYANSLGQDFFGERSWVVTAPLPPEGPDGAYAVSYTVVANALPPGIYEFGAIARLAGMGINCFCEGDHVEISPM